jgi:hypothetical protein
MKKIRSLVCLPTSIYLAISLLVAFTSAARATTWTWDPTLSSTSGSDSTSAANDTWSEPGTVANWYNGTTNTTYGGTTSDTVVFGSASTPTGTYTVNLASATTVNAGYIDFAAPTAKAIYDLTGKNATTSVINGPASTLYINSVNQADHDVKDVVISTLTFQGSSLYEFTTGVNDTVGGVYTSTEDGVDISTGVTFANNANIQAGSGSDNGSLLVAGSGNVDLNGTGTLTVENGWTLLVNASGGVYTGNLALNGMGLNAGGGAADSEYGTVAFGSAYALGNGLSGNISLLSDSAIVGSPGGNGTYNGLDDTIISGNISGSANLYLGYYSGGAVITTTKANDGVPLGSPSVQQLIIGGTTAGGSATASTNTGATILFNTVHNGDNSPGNGGVASEAIVLGQNNGLSNGTTLILGQTGSYAETSSIAGPDQNGKVQNVQWTPSDGAFDLHGYSQSVQGLIVGGVGQNGGADVLVQGNNLIFNNGTGTATLTVTGKTGNAVATGFGGVIEDNVALNTTGGTANTNSNGGKVAVEVNGQGVANAATLILSGQNTYSGGTTVDHMGLLEVGTSTTASGTTTGTFGTGSLSVNTGGTVDLEGASVTVSSTTLGVAGDTVANTIQSSTAGATGVTTTNGTLTSTNGVTVNGTSNVIASGVSVVAGSAGINVSASSALAVNSGATIDNLNVKTASSSATLNGTSTGNIVVGSGSSGTNGSLTGTGTANQLTLQSGGLITPGNGTVGSKLAASNISGTGTGELAFTLSASGGVTQETSLLLSGAFGSNSSNSFGIYLSGNVTGLTTPGTYNFELVGFNSTPFTNLSTISLVNAPTLDGQESGILTLLSNQLDYTVTVIPEPGTWAMLLGGVALLVIYQRRRRSS